MRYTENYRLPQIELEDNYDIEHFNDGWRKTDEELKRLDVEVQKRVNYDDTEIREMINETNTSLDNLESEVNELKEGNINVNLTNYATKTELSLKVDKVTGKSLISDSEIERLSTLKNYDDSNILAQLNDIENEIDELKEGNIEIDLTNYVTKNELSTKADKSTLTAHISDTTSHITATERNTWNTKSNLTLGTTSTTAYRGDYGNTAYTHSQTAHAPSNAQKNSDITKAEIEAKLTGNITSHTHNQYLTSHQDLSSYATKTELTTEINNLKALLVDGNEVSY